MKKNIMDRHQVKHKREIREPIELYSPLTYMVYFDLRDCQIYS